MWTKLDDNFPDHEKVMQAGPLASWLYVCGLCYSNRLLTDGFIPTGMLSKLAAVKNAPALAATLVHVGLWESVEGGYQVHDYHAHNFAAEEAKARRESISQKRAEAGRRGMAARWAASNKEDNKHNKPDNKTITPVVIGLLETDYNKTITPSRPVKESLKRTESLTSEREVNTTSAQRVENDNFTEFANEFWETYPARNGKRLKKKECFIELRKVAVADWDGCLEAARIFAMSSQALRGFAPDAFRWLRDDWKQWLTPETPHQEGYTNGNGRRQSNRDEAASEYIHDALTDFARATGAGVEGGNILRLPSGKPGPTH